MQAPLKKKTKKTKETWRGRKLLTLTLLAAAVSRSAQKPRSKQAETLVCSNFDPNTFLTRQGMLNVLTIAAVSEHPREHAMLCS